MNVGWGESVAVDARGRRVGATATVSGLFGHRR
jgi:hypothetical protein